MPDCGTINKAETANKIIFISFNGNVYTNDFTFQLSTCLFHTKGFTITRKTSNKAWVEKFGLNDFLYIREVSKLDKVRINLWNKILFYRRYNSRSSIGTFKFCFLLLSSEVPLAIVVLNCCRYFVTV